MAEDEKNVQAEEASTAEQTSTEETQPSISEQITKAMGEQMEVASRKFQSLTDTSLARIRREADSTARITEDAMAALDATSQEETEVAKPKRQVPFRSQLEVRRQQEEAAQKTVDAFESNIRQHIVDLGINPDDKEIEWGDRNNLNLTDRQGKILTSISKIQKNNVKLAEETRKQEFTALEAKLRKDLGLDKVDTTTSAGVATDSDSDFMRRLGSGELPLTKATTDRYDKIKDKY